MYKQTSIILAFCATLAACGGSSSEQAATTETSSEAAAETTIAAPTPVAETDFDTLYRELDATREDAYAKNDANILAQASGEKQAISDLQRRIDAGESTTKSDGYSYTIDEVSVFHVANENRVELRVVDSSVGETIKLDAEGNEIDRWSRDTPTRTFIVLLERTGIDDWLIHSDIGVPNDFPKSSDAFVEQKKFEVGDQTVSFKTADAGESQCYSLGIESDPVTPSCNVSAELDNFLATNFQIIGENEFEAVVATTLLASDTSGFFVEIDGESVEFFGDRNAYAVKVAEFGSIQQSYVGSEVSNDTVDAAPIRDRLIQVQEGTYVEEPATETAAAPPAEEPAPAQPAKPAPAAPTEPAPGVNEPGGPTIDVSPDGEITIGVGG